MLINGVADFFVPQRESEQIVGVFFPVSLTCKWDKPQAYSFPGIKNNHPWLSDDCLSVEEKSCAEDRQSPLRTETHSSVDTTAAAPEPQWRHTCCQTFYSTCFWSSHNSCEHKQYINNDGMKYSNPKLHFLFMRITLSTLLIDLIKLSYNNFELNHNWFLKSFYFPLFCKFATKLNKYFWRVFFFYECGKIPQWLL